MRENSGCRAYKRTRDAAGLDLDMLDALVDAARSVGRDESVRAVILRGDGDAFSSGLDFAAFSKQQLRARRRLPDQHPRLRAVTSRGGAS
jgi:enoyl-CoA hydratase/carnithine racemase